MIMAKNRYNEFFRYGNSSICLDGFINEARDMTLNDVLIDGQGHKYYYIHNSLKDFVEEVRSIPLAYLYDNDSETNGAEWSGSKSFQESLQRVARPHEWYKTEIDNIFTSLDSSLNAIASHTLDSDSYDFDVSGDYLDVGRFLEDQIDCFVRGDYSAMKKLPYVNLYVTSKYMAAHVGAREIERYATNVCTLVASLHHQKINVAVTYLDASDTSFCIFPLKKYGENLLVSKLYSVLHPSFFRRIVFRAIENSPFCVPGYGDPTVEISFEEFNKNRRESSVMVTVQDSYAQMKEKVKDFINIYD